MNVFAANETGSTDVSYIVTPSYTVNIPAGVTLDSENSVPANIEASNVIIESGKKIKVSLTGASNTDSGSSFSAKTEKGDSTATYTIGKGEATTGISIGDVVAEFTADGTQALTFSKAEGATHAGRHTETLTFTIAVEKAVKVETLLTTLTFGDSSTYSETTSGVVSVTATNVSDYMATYGWLWREEEGSLSVTAEEGYTITKCVFIQNDKTPITDTEAPFEIHGAWDNITEDTEQSMDGVTSIEVYGYAN